MELVQILINLNDSSHLNSNSKGTKTFECNVRYCSLDINNVEGYSDIKFRSSNVSENLGQLCNWRSEGGGCCFCFVLFIICFGYPQNYGYLSRSKPKVWHISS